MEAAQHTLELLRNRGDSSADVTTLETSLARYCRSEYRLAVVGEWGSGKSSFINALLGQEDLIPIDSDPANTPVIEVGYGVEYQQHSPGPQTLRIDYPDPWLASGLLLLDTPGLGGFNPEHADMTWQVIEQADSLVFILDSRATLNAVEQTFLQQLQARSLPGLFIQTRIDAVLESEWQQVQAVNREILQQIMGDAAEPWVYLPASSIHKLKGDVQLSAKHRAISRFASVTDYLQQQVPVILQTRLAALAGQIDEIPSKRKPRFELSANGEEVIDHDTGLIWRKDIEWRENTNQFTLHEAKTHASEVAKKTAQPWRIPTIDELTNLGDMSRSNPASSFPGMPAIWFWSSSLSNNGNQYVYGYGGTYNSSEINYALRLVRGG
jgi:GTP-binding protein EngB required for normal cell division